MTAIMPYIQKSTNALARSMRRNSPSILTGLAVAGVVSTTVLAVSATPRALYDIDDLLEKRKWELKQADGETELKEITKLDIIQAAWKNYIPAAIMGATTIICIVGANSIHLRRTAALASLYSLTETALRTYREKVVEVIGKKKEAKVHDDIAQDKLNANPVANNTIIITGKGEMLCYEELSGRYFKSDIETLRRVQNDFNKQLLSEMFITLNELYDDMGLPAIDLGRTIGWNIEKNMLEFRFSSMLTPDGQPCIVIGYTTSPAYTDY